MIGLIARVLPAVVALVLVGCGSSGPPFVMPDPPADRVTIYAFRPASIVGGGNSDILAVNDRFIGRVNSGTYAVYHTEPGPIVVKRMVRAIYWQANDPEWGLYGTLARLEGFTKVAEFNGKPGEVYFLRSYGELVGKKEALPLMDGLENITPKGR